MAGSERTRTGVCVVRAESDGSTGLRIRVTDRLDVEDDAETVRHSASIAGAVAQVREFLEAFERAGPGNN